MWIASKFGFFSIVQKQAPAEGFTCGLSAFPAPETLDFEHVFFNTEAQPARRTW